jgi:enediyne core biosynthesis thioesterase
VSYRYRTVVGFDETNLVGNVYYAHYVAWLERCRARFLRERVPDLIDEMRAGLAFATLSCQIRFLDELFLLDEVELEMTTTEIVQNRIALAFEYAREGRTIAVAHQELALMRPDGTRLVAASLPPSLREAFGAIPSGASPAPELDLMGEDGLTEHATLPVYTYEHVIGFEETEATGRVSHLSQVKWQGRCRELCFAEHGEALLAELSDGLALATVRCAWRGMDELHAYDRIQVHMYNPRIVGNRMWLAFVYVRHRGGAAEVVARGEQQVASMRRAGDGAVPAELPRVLAPTMRSMVDRNAAELRERGIDPEALVASADQRLGVA